QPGDRQALIDGLVRRAAAIRLAPRHPLLRDRGEQTIVVEQAGRGVVYRGTDTENEHGREETTPEIRATPGWRKAANGAKAPELSSSCRAIAVSPPRKSEGPPEDSHRRASPSLLSARERAATAPSPHARRCCSRRPSLRRA